MSHPDNCTCEWCGANPNNPPYCEKCEQQAEQIKGLREANAVLEKENKKWFAESEKAVGLHAENKRLKEALKKETQHCLNLYKQKH